MNTAKNKENAIAFYTMAYEGNPRKAIEKYVGEVYIQHNPGVADGLEGYSYKHTHCQSATIKKRRENWLCAIM